MGRKPGPVLLPAELEIEALARTVVCPNCGSEPGEACRGERREGVVRRAAMYAAHQGRLLAARAVA